ncbi:hypothetical protein [Apibacter sp. HY039]|uniref:hypothetical protein n=1 Tax=Apibacter sp. HY039 TaxID=2501476 RepID=UPI000FEB9C73|nr:hypothetical protein [Apibacter sp. HY039]
MKTKISKAFNDLKMLGIRVIFTFIIMLLLFISLNILAFCYPLLFSNLTYKSLIFSCLGSLCIAIIFIALAMIIYYRYAINLGLNTAYPYLEPFFRKICNSVISKTYNASSKKLLTNTNVKKTIDWKNSLNQTYQDKTPWILKAIISYLINKIPFVSILNQSKVKFDSGNYSKGEFNELFYSEVDSYIKQTFLSGFTLTWILGLFIINLVIQALYLFLMGNF